MDNLENNLPTPSQDEPSPAQYDSLRQLVVSILVLVIVISGTLNVFFLRQAKASRQELDAIRPQVNAMAAQFQRNVAPTMEDTARKLTEFARSNADFAPILSRHLSTPGTPGPAPAPAAQANKK